MCDIILISCRYDIILISLCQLFFYFYLKKLKGLRTGDVKSRFRSPFMGSYVVLFLSMSNAAYAAFDSMIISSFL